MLFSLCLVEWTHAQAPVTIRRSISNFVSQLRDSREASCAAANSYAKIVDRARHRGHLISAGDAQIAAIAASQHFIVAWRDETPFHAAGSQVIKPWTADVL